ncbi:MAG: hypothetical protein HKN25_04835 [Pyrinomonadaceae bacterium]|nr:hypothetical protein [Pyrinomonadaceae bacterium]
MPKRILIIDDQDDLATELGEVFTAAGHTVKTSETRNEAVALSVNEGFDMVITDLGGKNLVSDPGKNGHETLPCLPEPEKKIRSEFKAFKICLANYDNEDFSEEEINYLVSTTLNYKAKFIDRGEAMKKRREKIDFEVPSTIAIMHDILDYLMTRVEKLGVVNPEQSNLFVALDEAFVNAVKHGNKFDTRKLVKISVEISPTEASFSIEDEGEGFDVENIPDPTKPENLLKASGRGVMFIYNIMDEVVYNDRGNRITMIKKNENQV